MYQVFHMDYDIAVKSGLLKNESIIYLNYAIQFIGLYAM